MLCQGSVCVLCVRCVLYVFMCVWYGIWVWGGGGLCVCLCVCVVSSAQPLMLLLLILGEGLSSGPEAHQLGQADAH